MQQSNVRLFDSIAYIKWGFIYTIKSIFTA